MKFWKPVLFLIVFTASFVTLQAQERTGSIQGTITDPTRAVIPGATVEASSSNLVKSLSVNTDAVGNYLLPSLPPGSYTIRVSADGFVTSVKNGIDVLVGKSAVVNVDLVIGPSSVSVTVFESAPTIDPTSTAVSTNVSAQIHESLPGRSFDSLIITAPGARLEAKSGGVSIDGASGSENSYIIDGVEVTDIQEGLLTPQSRIPKEWVAETQVKSSGVDAQYGGAIGGVISAITKSGGNNFHGQLSLFASTDSLLAGPRPTLRLNPFDDDVAEYFRNTRDTFRHLNPGFDLGGPILKDRIWFFSSSRPVFEETERSVTFLVNDQTEHYTSSLRQDFTINKLDFAVSSKLRGSFSHYYLPQKRNGILPSQQGNDSPTTPFGDLGYRAPTSSLHWQADYFANSSLVLTAFGGYNYSNYKDYGMPRGTFYRFANANTNLPSTLPVPANLQGPAGNFTANNRQTLQDVYTRQNVHVIGSYFTNWHGTHNVRAGYELNNLHNQPVAGTWPDSRIDLVWNSSWRGITVPGVFRGPYGYYINRVFITTGNVSSNNQGLFLQDSWRIHKNLTLNLGLRTEREFLPSFRTDEGISSKAISFGFGDKIAPRIGFAWDPFGTAKTIIRGSFGLYYDVMKYEMPRGSFGGDRWKDYVYTLEDPNFLNIRPNPAPNSNEGSFTGQLVEVIDWRIPSNSPEDNLIDPDLKPMRQRSFDLGFEHQLTPNLTITSRLARKRLDRAIEDVGTLGPSGEKYRITNPGFGASVDSNNFPENFPKNVTPRAKRDYDALEFRLDRKFEKNFFVSASYTWSRLYGNYGGLASSDENGRTSPNVNRYFDLPWMNYDANGKLVYGRLATDRPHAFKLFASRSFTSKLGKTELGPVFFLQSGTPITTEAAVISSTPVFVNGRGDMGRTPVFSETSLLLSHEVKTGLKIQNQETSLRFELNVSNLFNQNTTGNIAGNYLHPNDGQLQFDNEADAFRGYNYVAMRADQHIRVDPRYGMASAFQAPRFIRIGARFIF